MRRTVALFAAALFGLAATPALPQDATALTVVHAGRLLDRPGQPPRGASTLLIRDGHIAEVRDGYVDPASLGVPEATVLDLRSRFVLPGLIDSHVHLTTDSGGIARQLEEVTLSPPAKAFNALVNARKTLDAGFTTVRNVGDDDGVTLALRDAIRSGKVAGPDILDAGSSISTTSGHMDDRLGFRESLHPSIDHANVCDGPDDCRRAVRHQVGRGVDLIKIATTGGVNSRIGAGLGQQMFDDEIKAIVDTARLYDKKVAVHAHGADGVRAALLAGVDSVEHGTMFTDEIIELFRKTGTYYVPTLSTVNGYIERLEKNPQAYAPDVLAKVQWRIGITGQSLQKAWPKGIKVAFGTDAGVSRHGRNADEFELMVKFGMTPAEAIHAATVAAADLLGVAEQVGTLEPGKRANLIAVSGDPLEDVTVLKRVELVIKDGRTVKAPAG